MSVWDLRLGRWEDVLADACVAAVVTDPPYGRRTHEGHDRAAAMVGESMGLRALGYPWWAPDDVRAFMTHWHERCHGWIVAFSCSDLAPVWREAADACGRMSFAPLPMVDRGSRVRVAGDGPSNWTTWINVSRTRTKAMAAWGTLPGVYERSPGDERSAHMGGKPMGVMAAIVRDYSRRGDLVCDPCAGGGTTLLAALQENRRALGAERDPEAYRRALARLGRGHQAPLFG